MIYKTSVKLLQRKFSSYSLKMFHLWRENPKSVHQSWSNYFYQSNNISHKVCNGMGKSLVSQTIENKKTQSFQNQKQIDLVLSAYQLIKHYKTNGHENACIDPLHLENLKQFGKAYAKQKLSANLQSNKLIKEQDFDISFTIPKAKFINCNIAGFLQQKSLWTLRQIKNRLQQIYSNKIGMQFMHIQSYEQQTFLMKKMQKIPKLVYSKDEKMKILEQLTKIQSFNTFLFNKIKTSKRFGVEGLDTMILGLSKSFIIANLDHLVQQAAEKDIKFIGFASAHRGRVNILANVFEKSLQRIFAQYQEKMIGESSWGISGDVNYHLGSAVTKQINKKNICLSILPNPSHLQTANPVAMGHVKAYTDSLNSQQKALCVIIHGDAAISGQGVSYQSLQLSYLPHYTTNGIIHIISNNQIGFTTTPTECRVVGESQNRAIYCSDIAKTITAPIIHVNAQEPQMVNRAMEVALKYRQAFKKDIFIDIVGYRRYGHNQLDQPIFTQPMMYKIIEKRENSYKIYSQKLIKQGLISYQQLQQNWQHYLNRLKQSYEQSLRPQFNVNKYKFQNYHQIPKLPRNYENQWKRNQSSNDNDENYGNKGNKQLQMLKKIALHITDFPSYMQINIHPLVKKIYSDRRQQILNNRRVDYAMAQALAFAVLLSKGYNIRLSGHDVERGTFSHRHAVLTDQKTGQRHLPLRNFLKKHYNQHEKQNIRIQIENSPLSQYAALGFEYGYSLTNLNTLCIWQAKYGNQANGASIVIDDYMSSGQSKWNIESGLVINLPHSYDINHYRNNSINNINNADINYDYHQSTNNSCRIQRYLQLVNDGWVGVKKQQVLSPQYNAISKCNIQVICTSTSQNLFQLYRRQMINANNRQKPLINVLDAKVMRNRHASSRLEDIAKFGEFKTVVDQGDANYDGKDIKNANSLDNRTASNLVCNDINKYTTKQSLNSKKIRKVIITYGHAYYTLQKYRNQQNIKDTIIIRIQQLAPFDYRNIYKVLKKYYYLSNINVNINININDNDNGIENNLGNVSDNIDNLDNLDNLDNIDNFDNNKKQNIQFIWYQNQSRNQGPLQYIKPRLQLILDWLEQQFLDRSHLAGGNRRRDEVRGNQMIRSNQVLNKEIKNNGKQQQKNATGHNKKRLQHSTTDQISNSTCYRSDAGDSKNKRNRLVVIAKQIKSLYVKNNKCQQKQMLQKAFH